MHDKRIRLVEFCGMHDFQFEEKYRKDTKTLEQKQRLDPKP